MDWHGGPKTAVGIMWFGIGALLGWPFAGALIIPFVIEDWLTAGLMGATFDFFSRYLDGVVRCLIVLAVQVSIDAFFYYKVVFVPLRIVLYNVFSGGSRGPDIFGTEAWHFYLRNLLLNFNLFFLLALASFPFLIIQSLFFSHQTTRQTILRTVSLLTPFYLWLGIFTLQPHKEERFMYPAYPFLALNAAISLHMLLTWLGTSNPRSLIGLIPGRVKFGVILLSLMITVNISLLRTLGTVTAYQAPLQIYTHLPTATDSSAPSVTTNVCIAKDWYRYPSSFHLPHNNYRIKFIPSSFHGLLPGAFAEISPAARFGLFPGTHLVPAGMNNQNQEDLGKYLPNGVSGCDYLVDTHFEPTDEEKANEEEPDYILDTKTWEKVACEPFLDASRSGVVGRVLWVPGQDDLAALPKWMERKWGETCLLRRRREG